MKEAGLIEIADFIRAKSSAGELTAWPVSKPGEAPQAQSKTAPILAAVPPPPASLSVEIPAGSPGSPAPPLEDVMLAHDDIKVVLDDTGNPFYYSGRFMTDAYASILVLKTEGPLRMMAEVIREHSRIYPRPVPVALFQCSPFNLDEDRISLCLIEMMHKAPYRDIAQITTSIGNVFVYSTDYLDRDYAAMLAEWVDVGQAENP